MREDSDGVRTIVCQCPLTGNTHFYYRIDTAHNDFQNLCQCPLTGNTHFYNEGIFENRSDVCVSMPSNGQHSFLHFLKEEMQMKEFCVNAL